VLIKSLICINAPAAGIRNSNQIRVSPSMTVRTLAKSEWQSYCDRISKGLTGKRAEIEVTGLTLGDQIAANSLPLLGITFDSKDDVLEIALEGLDHLIQKPRAISADDSPTGLMSMEVVDSDGWRQILKLRDPLMLPAPRK
jgi:Family of unknown function (DUF5335)